MTATPNTQTRKCLTNPATQLRDLLVSRFQRIGEVKYRYSKLPYGLGIILNRWNRHHSRSITCYRIDCRVCVTTDRAHICSPVVAESEGGTSDTPAQTVQESTDTTPGVGNAGVRP